LSTPFNHRSNQRISSGVSRMFGPGTQVSVDACGHGPIRRRTGARNLGNDRNAMLVYPSAHPPTIIVAASMSSIDPRAEPDRQ
jgi:hypothetical protein